MASTSASAHQQEASHSEVNSNQNEVEAENSMIFLKDSLKRLDMTFKPWLLDVLMFMDLTDKGSFVQFFDKEENDLEYISREFSKAVRKFSTLNQCSPEYRQQLLDHIRTYGGLNYEAPAGILSRLFAVARDLDQFGNHECRAKTQLWSQEILQILKLIFSQHSEKIRNLRKVTMIVNENEKISARCPECEVTFIVQRPNKHHRRFDVFIRHVLDHFPTAKQEYDNWKLSCESGKRKSSDSGTQQKSKRRATNNQPSNQTSPAVLSNSAMEENTDQVPAANHDVERNSIFATNSIEDYRALQVEERASMFDDDFFEYNSLPPMLKIFVKNSQKNSWGQKGNRFDQDVKELSSYMYIRMQKTGYEFLASNLNLPSVKTVKNHIDDQTAMHYEGNFMFDEFVDWLKANKYPLEVVVTEDGTKIVPKVEYSASTNSLTGLVAPLDEKTGFPIPNYFKVETAEQISKFMTTSSVSSYVQVFLGVPNHPGAPSYVLGYFGTDNRFLTSEVIKRTKFIKEELEKRGVKVLGSSTDGDSRALNSLKILMRFGELVVKNSLTLLADPDSEHIGNIDGLHKGKGLVDRLFNLGIMMMLGNRTPSANHLFMIFKLFEKTEHDLTMKDLDSTNTMNYTRIDKILSPKVFNLLKKIPHSEGTYAYLKLVESVMIAYVRPGVSSYERLKCGVFAVEFLRQWKQWLYNKGLTSPSLTVTDNIWESLELDLVFLYKMIKLQSDKNVDRLNSQMNEKFFRKLRSYTGMESTIANVTMKTFCERLRLIEHEENSLQNLKHTGIRLFKLEERENSLDQANEINYFMTDEAINEAVEEGKLAARKMLSDLGIPFSKFLAHQFCKNPRSVEEQEKKEEDTKNKKMAKQNNLESSSSSQSTDFFEVAGLKFSCTPSNTHELILANGQRYRKDQLVNTIYNDTAYISTDLKERFRPRGVLSITPRSPILNILWINDTISKGDIAIFKEKETFYGGLVFTFMHADRSTIKSSTFYHDKITIDSSSTLNIILEPLYEISSGSLRNIEISNKFFLSSQYTCHVKDIESLHLPNLFNLLLDPNYIK